MRCNKQENCRCKTAGTGIHPLAKLRAQILQFATTGITPWQTAVKYTADWQALHSGSKEYIRPGRVCGNPLSNLDYCLWQSAVRSFLFRGNPRSKHCRRTRSAVHIWARSIASEWNPAPAILHQESHFLMRYYFLMGNFSDVKLIHGGLYI
jgi:hypothetical protein